MNFALITTVIHAPKKKSTVQLMITSKQTLVPQVKEKKSRTNSDPNLFQSRYLINNSQEYLKGEIKPKNLTKAFPLVKLIKHPAPKFKNIAISLATVIAY